MKVSFLRTVRVAREHGMDEFFPAYVYDLPDKEAAVFIRNGMAYEASREEMVFDALLRLSWPSSRKWRAPSEVVKAMRSLHGIDMTEKEASRLLLEMPGVSFHPDGFYSISDPVKVVD